MTVNRPEWIEALGSLKRCERLFAGRARSRGGTLTRGGWPDFLLELPGRTIGVEVKSENDNLRPGQAKMFAALERAGIATFIWDARFPDSLTPWRRFRDRRRTAGEKARRAFHTNRRKALP